MELMSNDLKSIQEARTLIAKAKAAQEIYKDFTQEQIDKIVGAMAEAARKEVVTLAKHANEETGFGRWEDKVVKNKFSTDVVYNSIKDMKTVGILSDDKVNKVAEVAVPVGVIAALIPSTNPTSTVIFKVLIALKAGNAIILSPHPSAKNCIIETTKILNDAAVKAGAPDGLVNVMTVPALEGTDELMKNKDVSLILATGGEAMVRAAYSSGTPAIGVGPGNGPAYIDKSADIPLAVKRVLDSKTFDNGVICASEQSVIIEKCSRDAVIAELKKQGAYFLNEEESEKVAKRIVRPNGAMNPEVVGKSVKVITDLIGLKVPEGTRVLISEQKTVSKNNPYSREKLCPVLAFYCEDTHKAALDRCIEIIMNEGKGHTLCVHTKDEEVVKEFALKVPVSRLLINTPGALGGIGGSTNLTPSLTLGCGAIGRSSTTDNVGPMNLLNIRRVAYGLKELEELV